MRIDPDDWTTVAGFPNHEMNRLGDVRMIKSQKILKVYETWGSVFVSLRLNGQGNSRSVDKLYFNTFGEHLT